MGFDRIGKFRFEARIDRLNTVGNTGTYSKVIRSKKDRENDPKTQRKQKKWRLDID